MPAPRHPDAILDPPRKFINGDRRNVRHRESRFVAAYVLTLNASKAAIAAGYSPHKANVTGAQLLARPSVARAIEEAHEAQLHRLHLSSDEVLMELLRLARSNIADAFDANGDLLPIKQMPENLQRAIGSAEIVIKNAAAGDGHTDRVMKLRLWDKVKSLETLAKHLGLLTERIDVTGDVELTWKE